MFDAAFWATAGTISPWAIVSAFVLAMMRGWLKPKSDLDRADAEHAKQVSILDKQIDTMTVAHDKQVAVITEAHNLRTQMMTDAHNKATDERRADHDKQIAQLNEMYSKQVDWGFTDRNQWHDAYDDLSAALGEVAPALEKIAVGQETVVTYMGAIKKLGEAHESG